MGGSVTDRPETLDAYHRGFPVPPPEAGPGREPHTGISPRTAWALVLAVVLVVGFALLHLVTVPKVVYRPGPVYDTLGEISGHPVIEIEGTETYETEGRLDFTTITLHGGPRFPVTAWDWLAAELDPRADVVDESLVFPEDVTAEEVQEQNAELMRTSQDQAAVVALRAHGVEVPEQILVAQVLVDAPAAGVLRVNDQIVSVDGTEVANPDEVRDVLQRFEPGTEVPFVIVRNGQEMTLDVPTGESEVTLEDGTTEMRTVIGVYLASDFELPVEVSIDAGNVGGPSAGLMFSLAVYDQITPGPLTGGLHFAGTGTINSAGEVGPIGGIRQKMIAAADAGADYFLAPADNCGDVRGNEPEGLEVVAVSTFDEAREVVEALGEGEQPELPRC